MSTRRRKNVISSDDEGENELMEDVVPVTPTNSNPNRPQRRNSARRPQKEEDSFDDSEGGDSADEESFDEDEDDRPKKKAPTRSRAPRGGAAKQDMKQTKLSNFPLKQVDPHEEDKKAPVVKPKAVNKRGSVKTSKSEPKRGTKRKRADSDEEELDSENSDEDAASYGDDENSEDDGDDYDSKKKGSANAGGRARKVPSRFTPEDIEPKKSTRTSSRSKKPEEFAFPVVTLRQKKKIDYNMDASSDSGDYASSDDEGEDGEDKKSTTSSKKGSRKEGYTPPQDATKHVEKILAMRAKSVEAEKQPSVTTQSSQELPHLKPGNPDDPQSNEYLVKYKDLAYIHCAWVSADFIEAQKMGKQKLQRFMNKVANTVDPEEPFPSDWVVVERVVAKETRDDGIWYLVKWEGLPYSEATWEREKDVNDDDKIKQYEDFNIPPKEYKEPPRPPADGWYEYKECPQFKHDNQLRAYQLEGLNWLRYCWYNRTNSILADEMGLGKTVQSVSIINSINTEHKNRGPFLVIAPLSTIPHWEREFENWTFMNVIVYHGNSDARSLMRKHEFHYTDENNKVVQKNLFKFNTLITTFEMIITDSSILSQIKWKYVVIDEAHRLKNRNSRILTEFKHFKFDHLLLLTGTPIQNNTEELWTLLNVLDEKNFPSLDNFLQEFGELKEAAQVKSLHSLLKPYLLRRMKEDVEKSLAPKEETIIEVELTRIQKKYYKAILERNFEHLRGGGSSKNLPSLLNIMMELRKCCNHPFLVKGVEEAEMAGRSGHEETNKVLIDSSGKLVLIDKLLPKLQAEGHKVLIFSQMIRVLDILEDYMNYRGYKHERIDGRVRGNDRQAAIDRFSKPDSDIFAFLLCTRAGGLGINLVAADTVIIYDSDWNPQNDLQAQARAHRIGQQKTVKIYRLITRNTYERQMFERASLKLGLDQAVLNQMEDSDGPAVGGKGKAALTSKEVDSLLKYGAYDIFRDEDDAAQKFCEDDIDSILQRRTTTIVQETKEGSSFAKASFASESAVPDIDIDDPEFWKKIMPDVADKPAFDLMAEPRQRKQVQRLEVAMSDESDSDDDDRDTAVMPSGGGDEDSDQLYTDDEKADELNPEDHELPHQLQKKKGKKGEWSVVHRNRFQKSMLNFGFGRWKRIREAARLGNRPLREIALYGLAYLCKIAKVLKEDEKALFTRVYSNDPVENVEDSTDKVGEESAVPALDQLIKGDESKANTEVKTEPAAAEQKPAVQAPTEGAVIVEQSSSAAPVKVEPAIEPMQVETPVVETATEAKAEATPAPQVEQANEAPKEEPKEVKEEQTPQQEQAPESMQVEQAPAEGAATEAKPDETSAAPTEPKPSDEKSEAAEEAKSEAEKKDLEPHRVYENDPSLNDTKWLESLEKTGPSIVRRLELLAEIGYLVRTNFSEFEGTWVDYEFPDYPNWGEQEDRDLLKGTYKHGFGKYEKIRTDPDLCFIGKPKSFYEQEPVDEKKKKKRERAERERAEKARAEAEKAAAEKGEAMQVDQPAAEGAPQSEPKAETKPEEVKTEAKVEEPKAEEKPAEEKQPAEEKKDDGEWLAAGPLSLRVKWLLKGFNSLRKRMEKQKRRHESQAAKDKKIKMKQERKDKLETEWSKREKQDFYRALITYGVPIDPETKENNFDFLKQKAKLGFKNSQTISQYYVNLLKMTRQLKQSKSADPTKHKHKKQKTGEEAEKIEKPEDYGLSEIQAMRALERVIMFINLRKKVLTMSTEELTNRFKYARPREAKLPSWWVTPEHDIALLKGVDKHGYSKWEDVCNDKDLPFFDILSPMKPLEKKEKKKKPKPGAPATDANNTNVPSTTASDAAVATEAKPAVVDLPITEKDHEASTEEKKDDHDKEDKDDNEGDGEDQKFKTGLAQHMPRESILWKRIQQLIKLATDTQLQFKPAPPTTDTNKATKQAMLSFGNGSILVSNDDNKDMDDFQAPKKKAKKRKREDGAEEGGNDDDKPAKKRRTGANGRGRNVDIHRDSSDNIVFPIKIGVATLIEALGTINPKPNFHSEKYIWPIGFKSTREFTSTKNIEERCMYTCEIIDGGDKPIFKVTPADDPETPSEASSASQAWKQILMRINERKPEQAKRTSVSGPEYFGFGFPAIADLIAKLPNAEKCTKYKGPDAVERPGKKEDEEGDDTPKVEKKKKDESGEKEKKKKKSKISFPALAVEPAGKKVEGAARFDLPVQAPMPSLGGLPTIASLPVHRPEVTPVNIQPAPVSIQPAPVNIQPAPMNIQPVPTGAVSLLSDETFVPGVHQMPIMQPAIAAQWYPAPMSYAGYPPLMPVHQFPVITNPQMNNNNNNQPPQQK